MSIAGILLCIVALCSMTYAWFTGGTANEGNTLVAGSFDLVVAVEDDEARSLTVSPLEDGSYSATLPAGTYRVTLTMTADTNVSKGYCLLTVNDETYRTNLISADGDNPFSFLLVLPQEATVCFKPAWGTPATWQVADNGTLDLTPTTGE